MALIAAASFRKLWGCRKPSFRDGNDEPGTRLEAAPGPNPSTRSFLYASRICSRSVTLVSYYKGSGPRVLSHVQDKRTAL